MSNKKRKQRRNHFSSNWQVKDEELQRANDELINPIKDDDIIPITGINADEDAIDRLLMDAPFDVDDGSLRDSVSVIDDHKPVFEPQTSQHKDKVDVIAPIEDRELDLADDELLITPEKTKPTRKTNLSKNRLDNQVNEFIKSYFVKRKALVETDIEQERPTMPPLEELSQQADDDYVMGEEIPTKHPQHLDALLEELADKTRKNQLLTYSALGFAAIALISCTILGLWSMEAKSKLSKHSELIDIIEEDVANLNEKTATIGNDSRPLTAKPSALPSISATPPEPIKTVDVRSASTTLVPAPAFVAETNNDNTNTALVDESVATPRKKHKKPVPEQDNTEATNKTVVNDTHLVGHKKLPKIALTHETPADKSNAKEEAKAAQRKARLTELAQQHATHKTYEADKVKVTQPIIALSKKDNKNALAETWVVNIAASKQHDYIKSQAQTLAKRGIPVKIIPVMINNGTWYRLRAGSFTDKDSANTYANKIRHSFNLNSVWVGNQ